MKGTAVNVAEKYSHVSCENGMIPEPEKQNEESSYEVTSVKTSKNNAYILFVFIVLGLSGIFLTYFIALERGHVRPFLPFISQAGGSPPQSGIFTLILFFLAVTGSVVMTLRYYVVLHLNKTDDWKLRWANRMGLLAGMLVILGLLVTGAYPLGIMHFKEDWFYSTLVPHLIGASTILIAGTSYLFWQNLITFFFIRQQLKLFIIRVLVFVVCLSSFTPCGISFIETSKENNPELLYQRLRINGTIQNSEMSYSKQYVICSTSEWVLVIGLILYMATFYPDLKRTSLSVACKTLVRKDPSTSTAQLTKSPSNLSQQHQ